MNDLFGYTLVQSGIPIPENRVPLQRVNWDGLKDRLRFDDMDIGDSFAVDPAAFDTDALRTQNYVSGAACSYRKTRDDWAFTTRQMADGTVRCWRIDPADAKRRGE